MTLQSKPVPKFINGHDWLSLETRDRNNAYFTSRPAGLLQPVGMLNDVRTFLNIIKLEIYRKKLFKRMANHGFLESRAQKSCFKKGRGKHNLARPIARRRQPPTSAHHRSRYDAPPPSARLQGNIDLRPPRPAAASPATPSPVSG